MGNIIKSLNFHNETFLTLEKTEDRLVYSIINISLVGNLEPNCDTGICDVICDQICDEICDQVCSGVCDSICDEICDVFCDKVYTCDTNFVCDEFCDRVVWGE